MKRIVEVLIIVALFFVFLWFGKNVIGVEMFGRGGQLQPVYIIDPPAQPTAIVYPVVVPAQPTQPVVDIEPPAINVTSTPGPTLNEYMGQPEGGNIFGGSITLEP